MSEIKFSKKKNIFTNCFDDLSSSGQKRNTQLECNPKIEEVNISRCTCSDRNNYYDVSGENHCLAMTITDYDKPLTMRWSAIKDNSNLESVLKQRGFNMNMISGRVTSRDFKQELSNVLQKIDEKRVSSFLLALSCHGVDDELLFSDNSRYEISH